MLAVTNQLVNLSRKKAAIKSGGVRVVVPRRVERFTTPPRRKSLVGVQPTSSEPNNVARHQEEDDVLFSRGRAA